MGPRAMSVMLAGREYIDCTECDKRRPQKEPLHGVRYGICGESGNIVYLEPWKEKKKSGKEWLHYKVGGCCLYEKKGISEK